MNVDVSPEIRLVALDAVHNFRDMGGYDTADGRTTRWGMLYRADGLYRLTDADLEVVAALGLRTVIDLRTPNELDERGRFPFEKHPVDFHHLSVIDATWQSTAAPAYDTDAEFLTWAYRQMRAQGGPRFVAAINVLARPDALPAVFHCAAGKDRTGLLAALLLGALGVSHDQIVADYALTAEGMERMRAWATREFPDLAARMADTPSAMLAAVPEAMASTLAEICAEHGTVRSYVVSLGVTQATLDSLADALLH